MSAQAAPVAARTQQKVLRIGLVQDGKIQERLLRLQETVTVGDGPKVTFAVQGTKIGARHELLVPKGDQYLLQVPDWVEGKLQYKGGMADLADLRSRPETTRKGDIYCIPIDDTVRGKVAIGPISLLFQFVPAPPEPVKPISAADFRPRFFDEDDPLFLGLLGVFTSIAAVFMVLVYTMEIPERLDVDAVEDALDLVVTQKIEAVVIEQPGQDDQAATEAPKPTDAPKSTSSSATPSPSPSPASGPPSAESVAKKSLLLQMLGTVGSADGNGAVEDLLGDESAAMAGLDQALSGVSGAQSASTGNLGTIKTGSGGGREDAKVGVGVATGGTSGTSAGVAVVVKKPKVDYGSVDAVAEAGDAGSIASVVRKNSGRIASCVEQGLKQNPDLNGRVSVGFDVVAGKVTSSRVVSNTTGSDAVGTCIANAIRAIRFDPGLTAEVSEYPFAVSGQ